MRLKKVRCSNYGLGLSFTEEDQYSSIRQYLFVTFNHFDVTKKTLRIILQSTPAFPTRAESFGWREI